MKKVLVMGGGGFVGQAALKALAETGVYAIHAVYRSHPPAEAGSVTWHKLDLLDKEGVDELFALVKPEALMQLAWCSEHGVYWKDMANLDWLIANLHIARAFVKHGGQRCLFAGTSAEYEWKGVQPLEEFTTPLRPVSLYGSSKLGLYWALAGYFEQEGISWSWARLFNPFGPGEDARRLIPKMCLRLLRGEQINFDAGLSLRDFLHVDDVGRALAAVLRSEASGPFNIGSGEAITIREVVEKITFYCGKEGSVHFEAPPAGYVQDAVVADTTRLRELCGWKPSLTFETGIQQACQWWKAYFNHTITNVDKA